MKNILIFICFVIFIQQTHAQEKIVWSDLGTGRITKANLDGSEPTIIVAQNKPQYHALDSKNAKIYWTDMGTLSIHSCNLDGSNKQVLVSGLDAPRGIDLSAENEIFVIDGKNIKKFNTSGELTSIIHQNLEHPIDLFVHESDIYWLDSDKETIERSKIDGSQRTTLVSDVPDPFDIELDIANEKIYWVQYAEWSFDKGVFRANLDGSEKELFPIDKTVYGIEIDDKGEYIYWSELIFNTIHKTKITDLSDDIRLVGKYLNFPTGIVLDEPNNKIYYLNQDYAEFLFCSNLDDGKNTVTLGKSLVYKPSRFVIDSVHHKIYWINHASGVAERESAGVMCANLDGSNVQTLAAYPDVNWPFGIALDIENEKIYWSERSGGYIHQANLDGSNMIIINPESVYANGMTIDADNQKLYWTSSKGIEKSNLDGSQREFVLEGSEKFYEVALYLEENKIYWTNRDNKSIQRTDLDEVNIETLFTENDNWSDVNSLCLHKEEQKIYYSIDGREGRIQRSNYDGSDVELLGLPDVVSPYHLVVLKESAITSIDDSPSITKSVRVYPNPFSDKLVIESKREINSISIYNELGQVVFNVQDVKKTSFHLDGGLELKKGFFSIIIEPYLGEIERYNLIKH